MSLERTRAAPSWSARDRALACSTMTQCADGTASRRVASQPTISPATITRSCSGRLSQKLAEILSGEIERLERMTEEVQRR